MGEKHLSDTSSHEYVLLITWVSAAKRSKYSVFFSRKLKSTFAASLPPWEHSLEKVMGSL